MAVGICGSSAVSASPCEALMAAATRLEPALSVHAFGGRLVGSNHGEFGGELTFEPLGGSPTVLAKDNIVDIIQTPSGLVAVAGLSHLIISRGAVYVIDLDARGMPQAEKRALPGEPVSIKNLSGDILIATRVRKSVTSPLHVEYVKITRDRSIAPLECE